MPRLIVIAAAAAFAAFSATQALAADPDAGSPGAYLTWPGKVGAPAQTQPQAQADASPAPGAVALSKQFFTGADLAAPPGPLMPHAVPGTASVTNQSTFNTPSNRAEADMLTPVGDAVVIQ